MFIDKHVQINQYFVNQSLQNLTSEYFSTLFSSNKTKLPGQAEI